MNRKILPGLVGVLLLLVAAGAFYGGMRFQGMRSSGTRANFFANRGGADGANFGGGGGGGGGGGRLSNMGQIKSIEGNVIIVSTQQERLQVTVTDATKYQRLVDGKLDDLQVGANIIVRGESDANGVVNAVSIQLADSVPAPLP